MARDCWEGHRPHAIPTALTARLLRWASPRCWRPASCAGRWAAGWATATTWRVVEKQRGCGGGASTRRRRRWWPLRAVAVCGPAVAVIRRQPRGGMEACLVPDTKGAGGASVLRLVVQTRDRAGAVVGSLGVAAAVIGDRRQQGNHQTPATLVPAHALIAICKGRSTLRRSPIHVHCTSTARPPAAPASSVPAGTTRTLLPASSTASASAPALTTTCHISRTPHHNVDQSATAVSARRPHQALAAGAPTRGVPQPAFSQPRQPDIAVTRTTALGHRVARVASRRYC